MEKLALLLAIMPLTGSCSQGDSAPLIKAPPTTYSGKPWRSLMGYDLEVSRVVFSSNGKWLAAAGQNSIVVTIKEKGHTLKLQGAKHTIRVWDTATWKQLQIIGVGFDEVIGDIAFSPDSKILTVSVGTKVMVYRTSNWKVARILNSQMEFSPLSFSPHGNILAVGATLLNTSTWKVLHCLPTKGDVYSVAFACTNHILATGTWNGAVQLWDWKTGKQVLVIQSATNNAASAREATLVVFSPDGKLLCTVGENDEVANLWDTSTGKKVLTVVGGKTIKSSPLIKMFYGVDSVTFSPDSKKLVTASISAMKLWDIATGHVLYTFHDESGNFSAHDVAFSTDGRLLGSASRSYTVDLWKVP